MREKDLTSKLLRALRKIPHSWWYKIPDPARCPKCGNIALVSKRPFDIVGCIEGEMVAIEVKVRGLKDLAPHQQAALKLVEHAQGVAVVIVGSQVHCYDQRVLRMITGVWN